MGRSIRTRQEIGGADVLLSRAYRELNSLGVEMLSFPTRSPITGEDKTDEISKCCEEISDTLADWPELPDLQPDVTELQWPEVTGQVTDFQPRKGRKLQRWKRAATAASLVRLAAISVGNLEGSIDAKLEAINEDENASLDEIARQGAWYEVLGESLWKLIGQLDRLADRIEAVRFPALIRE